MLGKTLKKLNLTQATLSRLSGINASVIYDLVHGTDPRMSTFWAIREAVYGLRGVKLEPEDVLSRKLMNDATKRVMRARRSRSSSC